MSASEKLKALEERWWKDPDEAHRMFYALPQIRAVVEAAERAMAETYLEMIDAGEVSDALAALDKALL